MLRSCVQLLVVLVIVCLSQACGNRKSHFIPVEDFFSSSEKTNFKLSPNGKYIAYLGQYNGQQNIYIIHLDEGNMESRLTAETEPGIHS